ncbi:hypothetical protein QIS74_05280 [Colletotrichum tabaci]|uniref:Uncharacterized protein n=1 Tax=Colletotrichum tabaci TaxID=1209068 RepID=A0AAV9TEN8_9PEZI
MAKSQRGSSLPQARSHHHNHYHLHDKRAATPENAHHHQHRQLNDDPSSTPSPDVQSSTTSGPKVVVQTVSLVQIVDASGVPIEVQTIFPTSATVDAEPATSAALGFSIAAAPSSSSSSSSLSTGDPTSESSTTTITSSSSNDASLSTPAATTSSPTDPSASQEISLTDPLTTTPAPSAPAPSLYLTLSGQSNSTICTIPYFNELLFNISLYHSHFNEPAFIWHKQRNVFIAFFPLFDMGLDFRFNVEHRWTENFHLYHERLVDAGANSLRRRDCRRHWRRRRRSRPTDGNGDFHG